MSRRDGAIRKAVLEALSEIEELENATFDAAVDCGCVTLQGDVDDHHAAWCAVRTASTVAGVIHVRGALRVRPELGEERAPLETEFRTAEDAWFMVSPRYRWVDAL